jgi:Reverse transcriptase (RNA-dependent DNA polymerase)/GAG-pre-integrase domain
LYSLAYLITLLPTNITSLLEFALCATRDGLQKTSDDSASRTYQTLLGLSQGLLVVLYIIYRYGQLIFYQAKHKDGKLNQTWYREKPSTRPATIRVHTPTMTQIAFLNKHSESTELDTNSALLLDSGCSQHIFSKKELFTELREYQQHESSGEIKGIGETILRPLGIGSVTVTCSVNDTPTFLTLHNTLYCPALKANLISCSQLLDTHASITLTKNGCKLTGPSGLTVATAKHKYGLFLLETWQDHELAFQAYSSSADPIERLWHERLGHLGIGNLKKLAKITTGLDLTHMPENDCTCEGCLKGRMRDISHRNSLAVGAKPYEVIYSDVDGPMKVPGYDGSRYFCTFLDAATKESEIFNIKYKSEVPAMYRRYKAMKERPNEGRIIRRLHSDGGGEYLGFDFQDALAEDGTTFTYSTPYSQQQNGAAERLNRSIGELALAQMAMAKLHPKYWPEAVRHANYLRNRKLASGIDITPFEAATGSVPSVQYLRKFGCVVWFRKGSQAKYTTLLDHKAEQGNLVGFESPHIVRILNKNGRVLRASSVHFQENRMDVFEGEDYSYLDPWFPDTPSYKEVLQPETQLPTPEINIKPGNQPATNETKPPAIYQQTQPESEVRRSGRQRRRNTRALFGHIQHQFSAFVCNNVNIREQRASPQFASFAKTQSTERPSSYFAMLANRLLDISQLLDDEPPEPTTWKSAMAHPTHDEWLTAAKEELDSLVNNNTWTLVDLPKNQKFLPGKWVFKYKRNSLGVIIRYKARWVVKGYEQQEGIDYNETFASVVKPMSYKALFAIAASLDLEIEQMDVKTAFLYGNIDETIYVEQPHGLTDGSNRVCRLNKALYGLKQSPRVWYKTLSEFLTSQGFLALDADQSVFVQGSTYIAVYVDDLLIIGPHMATIDKLKNALSERFKMTNLGPVAFYLGMTITRDRRKRILRIGQKSYLQEAIRAANLCNQPAPFTPMVNGKLRPGGDEYEAEPEFKRQYQSLVGTLMYAMLGSRPDIAFAVSCVSRYASNPTHDHMEAVRRIFLYLQGTINYELTFQGDLRSLQGYSDSDWAGDSATSRSTAGFIFNIGSGAISWSSKRQPTVALSTCEAEYQAQTQAAKEAIWLRSLLRSLNPLDTIPYATVIYCDNQGAIALAKDPKFHARTKHIAIQHHWIREQIDGGVVDLEYVSTTRQLADGMTKALPRFPFEAFRDALGVIKG